MARGELLALENVAELKRRYGVTTLEEAFVAAPGGSIRARLLVVSGSG